jgi:hypothetical protein
MSLSDLASIAGVLSSLAVCASVIYLAMQVRQSDRNQRTLLQQATSVRTMETIWKFGEPHNAEIIARALSGEIDFTTTQATQLANLMRATLFGLQDQYLLEKLALVSPTQIATNERGMLRMFGAPAFRALWALSRELYAPDFARYVDSLLADLPVSPQSDLAAQLRVAAAELRTTGAT